MEQDKLEAVTTLEHVQSSDDSKKLAPVQTLGSVQLQHEETKEIILVPQPSNDPNDPLNW